MTTTRTATVKLTPAQRKGLQELATGGYPHGSVVNSLTRLGLVEEIPGAPAYRRRLTAAGRAAL